MEAASRRPRWTAGDQAAFSAFVRTHSGAVFGFALRRMRDRDLAEDVGQETFLRAWRGRAEYRGAPAGERGWLLAIAANVVRDHARSRARRPVESGDQTTLADVHEPGADPAARAEHAESIERLRSALDRLPEAHRDMFLLRERDGLSYKEIAAVLGCPMGTVMSGLSRARERLIEAVER